MMKYLHDTFLGQPLLAFAFAYYLIIILAGEVRLRNPVLFDTINTLHDEDVRKVKRNRYFRLISLGFISIIICFALYPHIYHDLVPIRPLKYPAFNLVGLVLLVVSFVKMLLVQMDMDKDLHLHHLQVDEFNPATLMSYNKKMAFGYFTMFIGITLILANIASVALLAVAAVVYRRK